MMKNKRILAIVISLLMTISVLPGMAFAAEEQSLGDYTGLQQGTTTTRIYMLNCGNLEETNPAVFGDNNEYTSRWNIKTDASKTEYFDNYIMNTLDTRKEIEFVFSIGGSGMNHLSDDDGNPIQNGAEIPDGRFKTGVANYVKVLNASGESQPSAISMIFTPPPGIGGGGKNGPDRAVDVIVKIAPNTLNANETYKLALTSGLSSGRDALDKDIYFTFTTAPILAEEITLSDTSLTLAEGASSTLKAAVKPERATNKAIAWTTSNAKVAAVSANGTIKAERAGNAVLTATAKDGSGAKATCAVKVTPVFAKLSMKAASSGHDSIKLSWSKDKRADGYKVYRRTAENKNFKVIADTKKQSHVDKKLATGQKYTYKVRAYRTIDGKKVYGSYSTAKSAKPIPAPAKAKVKAGKGKVTVKWNPVPGAEKYVVYKSTQKNKDYYKVRITVKTAFTDTDVKSGKTYYYKVRNYKTVKGKKIYGKRTRAFQVKVK